MFGRSFIDFTQGALFSFNVAMLILGPITLIVLHYIPKFPSPIPPDVPNQQTLPLAKRFLGYLHLSIPRKLTLKMPVGSWSRSWRWGKFWAIFILGVVFQVILVATIISANRFVSISGSSEGKPNTPARLFTHNHTPY